jgi:hypothetical protein
VVDILPAEIADEAALMRAAYGLSREAQRDVGAVGAVPAPAPALDATA